MLSISRALMVAFLSLLGLALLWGAFEQVEVMRAEHCRGAGLSFVSLYDLHDKAVRYTVAESATDGEAGRCSISWTTAIIPDLAEVETSTGDRVNIPGLPDTLSGTAYTLPAAFEWREKSETLNSLIGRAAGMLWPFAGLLALLAGVGLAFREVYETDEVI